MPLAWTSSLFQIEFESMKHIKYILIGLVVIVIAIFFSRKVEKTDTGPTEVGDISDKPGMAYVKADRATLENKTSNDWETSAAVVRLSALGEKKAFEEAKKLISSPSDILRAGAAEALGYDPNPEVGPLVAKALQDKVEDVRKHAIVGLGYRNSAENLNLLKELLASGKLSETETVSALGSLIKISESLDDRLKIIADLIKIAKTGKTAAKIEAIKVAAAFGPREDSVIDFIENFLKDTGDGEMTAFALRHLAAVAPAKVTPRLDSLSKHPYREVRLAVIQTLPLTCPIDRWKLLKDAMTTDKEPIVFVESVETLVQLGGKEALDFANRMKGSSKLGADQETRAEERVSKSPRSRARSGRGRATARKRGGRSR